MASPPEEISSGVADVVADQQEGVADQQAAPTATEEEEEDAAKEAITMARMKDMTQRRLPAGEGSRAQALPLVPLLAPGSKYSLD